MEGKQIIYKYIVFITRGFIIFNLCLHRVVFVNEVALTDYDGVFKFQFLWKLYPRMQVYWPQKCWLD